MQIRTRGIHAFVVTFAAAVACTTSTRVELPKDAGKDGATRAFSDAGHDAGVRDAGELAASNDAAPDASALAPEGMISPVPPRVSEELTQRMHHLVDAISNDNVDLARDAFYPRAAFLKEREAKDPAKLWDQNVLTGFKKNVHKLNKKLNGQAHVKFQSFDLGQVSEHVPPHSREWLIPTHQAHHARLIVMLDGKPVTIPVTELVAHRGYWYVTKL
jgi:hypothetical protein